MSLSSRLIRAALTRVPERQRRLMLLELARLTGATSVRMPGDLGDVAGSPHDRTVFESYATRGTYPGGTADLFRPFFAAHRRATYIDVGANIGMTVLPIARAFPDVTCIAIEPEPLNFALLRENLAFHGLDHVHAINAAVFSEAGTLDFELSDVNFGDHRVRLDGGCEAHQGERGRRVITVRGDRLGALVAQLPLRDPIAIKIDVQGAEHHVWRGARDLIRRAALVAIEITPYQLRRLGADPDDLIRMIASDFAQMSVVGVDGYDPRTVLSTSAIHEAMAHAVRHYGPDTAIDLLLQREPAAEAVA